MTEKVSLFKLLLAVMMILATPLLFFRSVGENPLKVKENATKAIAIVNEDAGTEVDGEPLSFGGDVTSILEDQSSFEWTVVGRSAGENGLQSSKYDAVVYIPSDFSNKVMTYDEERPEKTNLNFKVQPQLNAVNKEKVQLEIEKATKRVNHKMSSLYWNYVSADMENIRAEFDEILQKEQTFQETMLAFYKPSSKDLAGQIEQQTSMLSTLQNSIQQADSRTPEQQNTLESFEQSLSSFVEYVNQYRDYQDNQKKLLADIQSQSVQMINESTENQQPRYLKSKSLFSEQSEALTAGLTQLNSNMDTNQEVFTDLQQRRFEEVGRQVEDFYSFQERVLNFYQQLQDTTTLNNLQGNIFELNNKLAEGDGEIFNPPAPPEIPDPPKDGEDPAPQQVVISSQEGEPEPGEPTDPPPAPPNLDPEIAELKAISVEMDTLKETLTKLTVPTPEDITAAVTNIQTINDRILQVRTKLQDKNNSSENPLQAEVDRLLGEVSRLLEDNQTLIDKIDELTKQVETLTTENEELKDQVKTLTETNEALINQLEMFSDNISNIVAEIEDKESSILNSAALSENRRNTLYGYFSRGINNYKLMDLLQYYSYLDRYEATLNGMLTENGVKAAVLQDEELKNEVNEILKVSQAEQTEWEQLSTGMPTTEDALTTLQDSYTVFAAEYNQTIDDQQSQLTESLNAINQESTNVLNRIQQPEQAAPTPVQGAAGPDLVGNQKQIGSEIKSIHSFLDTVSESQSTIVSYTSELQSNVSNVQSDADTLNNKWATNVASTQLIRDDVFSVLGNAFVDGQSNGYVYDFLTNPLNVKGDVPEEKSASVLPPVVILFIVLLSSLLIGYTSYYFQNAPLWIQGVIFLLLNLIVGFVISLYGLDIYPLVESRSVEWTVFTILLLLAASGLVRVAFVAHRLVGWFVSVGLITLFVTPLLALTTPNFNFKDPMSTVYMSIQYGTESLFNQAVIVLGLIVIGLAVLQLLMNKRSNKQTDESAEAYEG
ncbi:type VII secretion protein EsaA [Rossellomorea vietnamensis]|uniref:type VII secretion protein EsaA n=1 Tax=Rossellomorea vietnamensis TaxID=218284 RepID=UPI001E44DD5A|nr:type VII secretion protein EsaA [Rossellomorea vietnamensis]MCC5803442.1 type VII secretion protein EsaA [Rossellomorea vietnamensis]